MTGPAALTPGATATSLRHRPVCETRLPDGRYCSRLAVAIADMHPEDVNLQRRVEVRCPEHAPPGALFMCLACRNPNGSSSGYHCGRCAVELGESDR